MEKTRKEAVGVTKAPYELRSVPHIRITAHDQRIPYLYLIALLVELK